MKKLSTPITLRNPARLGWIPDLPDKRDKLYSVVYKAPSKLPPKVDLREDCSPVESQDALGSCTANALAGALEFLERKKAKEKKAVDISRLFIYYNERAIEHTVDQDSGAMIRDGIKVLAKLSHNMVRRPNRCGLTIFRNSSGDPAPSATRRPKQAPSIVTNALSALTKCVPASRRAIRSCSVSARTKALNRRPSPNPAC